MADEKKIADEMLTDDKLDKVAGGDELVLDGVADRFYARYKGGDVKPDVKVVNPEAPKQYREILW